MVAYLKRDFLAANPNSVPQEYWLGDKALYLAALEADLQVYSRDGIVSAESRARSLRFLQQLDIADRRRAHQSRQDLGRPVGRGRGKAQLTCA